MRPDSSAGTGTGPLYIRAWSLPIRSSRNVRNLYTATGSGRRSLRFRSWSMSKCTRLMSWIRAHVQELSQTFPLSQEQ